MDSKRFKRIIGDFLKMNGFSKSRGYFILPFPEIIIVLGLQKSSFAKGYYINLGYLITELNSNILAPRDVEGDIRARFDFEINETKINFFDLETITEEKLITVLKENRKFYIDGVNTLEELKNLVNRNPVMLFQTKLVAKQFLGFE